MAPAANSSNGMTVITPAPASSSDVGVRVPKTRSPCAPRRAIATTAGKNCTPVSTTSESIAPASARFLQKPYIPKEIARISAIQGGRP